MHQKGTVNTLRTGIVADIAGSRAAILMVAALTLVSLGVTALRLRETAPLRRVETPHDASRMHPSSRS